MIDLLSPFRKIFHRNPGDIHYKYPEIVAQSYSTILTDDVDLNPVKPGKKFDFHKYSDAVVSIVNGSEPKFSIGIYGEWGSGKTTLMRMIERKLKPERFQWKDLTNGNTKSDSLKKYLMNSFQINWIDKKNIIYKSKGKKKISLKDPDSSQEMTLDLDEQKMNAPLRQDGKLLYEFSVRKNEKNDFVLCENNILTVWFNAWRYENEEEFALIPLMKSIAFTIGDHPIYKDLKPLILRTLAIVGKDALRFYALKYFMTEKGVEEFENNLKKKFGDSEEFDREALYFEGIKKIEQKMLDILAIEEFKKSRIVVFVDDLDRCSPEKTLEVFESIKVFLDIKGFIFILGLSREALDKLIVARYENMGLKDISGEDYIRKIIQVEIQIGKWDDTSIGDLIDEISKGLDDKFRDAVKGNKELINLVVESNPRQTKRFINNLIIALTANPKLETNTFLCIEALQKRWISFYNNLSNTRFLKEIKTGLDLKEEERFKHLNKLEEDQKTGNLGYDLSELRICYIDEDLWSFLDKCGKFILKDITSSEEPTTQKEEEAAEAFETYKTARDSTEIPESISARGIDELDYYSELWEKSNEFGMKLQNNLFQNSKSSLKTRLELVVELMAYFQRVDETRTSDKVLARLILDVKRLVQQQVELSVRVDHEDINDKDYELRLEYMLRGTADLLKKIGVIAEINKDRIKRLKKRLE